MIRLVKVKQEFYSLCQEHNVDEELLFNEAGRPCVLLIRMNYKNNVHDFVVPLRSKNSAQSIFCIAAKLINKASMQAWNPLFQTFSNKA